MTELAKINRPEAKKYRSKRKIYYVKNLYLPRNATDRYKEIYFRYWEEVDDHIAKLENAGKIKKIFCESIYMDSDEAMKVLNAMNTRLEQIVKKKIAEGAELLPLEDRDLFGAYVDWNNCMMVVRTEAVYKILHASFTDTVKKRFEHINSVLTGSISDTEAALLIMRESESKYLDLPDDIEFFQVSPPAYDDLQQFINDRDSGKEYWRS